MTAPARANRCHPIVRLYVGLATAGCCVAATQQLDSSISGVEVYPGWARVRRQAEATLEPGRHAFVLRDLPAWIALKSVQADCGKPDTARIVSARARRATAFFDPEESLKAAEKAVEIAKGSIEKTTAEIAALETHLKHLNELMPWQLQKLPREAVERQVNAAELKEVNDYLEQARLETVGKTAALKVTLLDLQEDLKKREKERDETKKKKADQTTEIFVDLVVLKPGPVALSLSYLIAGASWYPEHSVTLRDGGKVAIQAQGVVQQATGEDWAGVPVALSASHPYAAQMPPQLAAWQLSAPGKPKCALPAGPPAGVRTAGSYSADLLALHKAWQEAMAKEKPSKKVMDDVLANLAQAAALCRHVRHLGVLTVSDGDGAFTAASDGQPILVPLSSVELPAHVRYRVNPAVSRRAFEVGRIRNTAGRVLLPGSASLIRDGRVVGRTQLSLVEKDHLFDLDLGPTERVTASRSLDRAASRMTRRNGQSRMVLTYRLTLSGAVGKGTKIEVRDQLAVAADSSITVTLLELQPRAEVKDNGVIEWEVVAGPELDEELMFTFQVDYPTGRTPPALVPLEKMLDEELTRD